MSEPISVEGELTFQYCQFETGLTGYKIDGKWLGGNFIDKIMEGREKKELPDKDRYVFTIPYGRVRITIERLAE